MLATVFGDESQSCTQLVDNRILRSLWGMRQLQGTLEISCFPEKLVLRYRGGTPGCWLNKSPNIKLLLEDSQSLSFDTADMLFHWPTFLIVQLSFSVHCLTQRSIPHRVSNEDRLGVLYCKSIHNHSSINIYILQYNTKIFQVFGLILMSKYLRKR